jgi:hypothetical protein
MPLRFVEWHVAGHLAGHLVANRLSEDNSGTVARYWRNSFFTIEGNWKQYGRPVVSASGTRHVSDHRPRRPSSGQGMRQKGPPATP